MTHAHDVHMHMLAVQQAILTVFVGPHPQQQDKLSAITLLSAKWGSSAELGWLELTTFKIGQQTAVARAICSHLQSSPFRRFSF